MSAEAERGFFFESWNERDFERLGIRQRFVQDNHSRSARGVVRVGGKIVHRGKQRLTMYLDTAIVEYFKSRAGTRGYQTLINAALKQAIEHEALEDTLRRVVREEIAPYRVAGKRSPR